MEKTKTKTKKAVRELKSLRRNDSKNLLDRAGRCCRCCRCF